MPCPHSAVHRWGAPTLDFGRGGCPGLHGGYACWRRDRGTMDRMGQRVGTRVRRARIWLVWMAALIPLASVLTATSELSAGPGPAPAGAAPLQAHGYAGGGMIGFGSVALGAPTMPQ